MKWILSAAFLASSLAAFSATDLATKKSESLKHLDERINALQDSRSCVAKANTDAAFSSCKTDMEAKMQRMEDSMSDKMHSMESSTTKKTQKSM